MKSGKVETLILFFGAVITLLVVSFVFLNKSKLNSLNPQQTVVPTGYPPIEEQTVSEFDKSIEEGLFLEITNPVDGSTVTSQNINVTGNSEANADIFINDQELRADLQGNFTTTLLLTEGENIIVITASDDEGNYAEKTIVVNYETVN